MVINILLYFLKVLEQYKRVAIEGSQGMTRLFKEDPRKGQMPSDAKVPMVPFPSGLSFLKAILDQQWCFAWPHQCCHAISVQL